MVINTIEEKETFNLLINKFFQKAIGTWKGYRVYYYVSTDKFSNISTESSVSLLSKTDLDIQHIYSEFDLRTLEEDLHLLFKWHSIVDGSKIVEGDIKAVLQNGKLYRSNGYFTKKGNVTRIMDCSSTTLNLLTNYDNKEFYEEFEYLSDNIRTRHMEAYTDGKLMLCGRYIEQKVSHES